MEDLVRYLAEGLVDNPDGIKIETQSRGRNHVDMRLEVDKADMGRVIGKGGRVANAIRNLVRVAAIKANKRVNLEIR